MRLRTIIPVLLAGAVALPAATGAATTTPGAKPPSIAPSVITAGISTVTYSSATLNGYVDAHGAATNYAFQYGTASRYSEQSPLAPAGNGTITLKFSQAIAGLQPGTAYHYRIIALSPSGRANGGDRTFTTAKIPLSVRIVGSPNPVLFGDPFFVEGNLSGTGAASHEVVLQANPFPYLGGFRTVGNPELSSSTGGFSFPVVGLTQNAQVRVITVGGSTISSPVVVENVAVRVTFHARRVRRHGFVRLYGTVAPAEVGALVGFQLLEPGHKSVNEGGTVVKAGTPTVARFSRVVRRHRGLYRALVRVSDGAHVSSYSSPILVR